MIEIFIGVVLLIEGVTILIVGARQVVKFYKFTKNGITLKQVKLENIGRMATLVGTSIVILVPRIAGFQDNYGGALFLVTSIIGFSFFLIGIRFINIAYKAEDENPDWIKRILKHWK